MKELVKTISFQTGKIFSCILSAGMCEHIRGMRDRIYSGWLSKNLKGFGKSALVMYPCKLSGGRFISINESVVIGKNSIVTAWNKYRDQTFRPEIKIGRNTSIGEYCHITAINKIIIGDGVLTGRWITITDNSHGKTTEEDFLLPPIERNLYSPGPVIIEDNVWIGDKVTILPNVRIGKNSVIGANSVVNKDIPANCVAAGNPARVVKIIN